MGKDTKISWCDSTINPAMGCDGCELHKAGAPGSHCYAAGLVGRYAGLPGWPASFDKPELFTHRIAEACRWSDLTGKPRAGKAWLDGYPRTIFLGDLADVFSESLPEFWMAPYLTAMAAAPHVWIICTKRPSRMRAFFLQFPCPPNFWLLTTVTSQPTTNRVAELLRIPGARVRGVSLEPLIGQVNLRNIQTAGGNSLNALTGEICSGESGCICAEGEELDWAIVGGESGPGARPMHPDWAASLRDQCTAPEAQTPFFFKQWGPQYMPAVVEGREWHQMPAVSR